MNPRQEQLENDDFMPQLMLANQVAQAFGQALAPQQKPVRITSPGLSADNQMKVIQAVRAQQADAAQAEAAQRAEVQQQQQGVFRLAEYRERQRRQAEQDRIAAEERNRPRQVQVNRTVDGKQQNVLLNLDPMTGAVLGEQVLAEEALQPRLQQMRWIDEATGQAVIGMGGVDPSTGQVVRIPIGQVPVPAGRSGGGGGGGGGGSAAPAAVKPLSTTEINRLENMDEEVLVRARNAGQLTPQQESYVAEILAAKEQAAVAQAQADAQAAADKKGKAEAPGAMGQFMQGFADYFTGKTQEKPAALPQVIGNIRGIAEKSPKQAMQQAGQLGVPVDIARKTETVDGRNRIVSYYVFGAGTPEEFAVEVE